MVAQAIVDIYEVFLWCCGLILVTGLIGGFGD